MWESLETGTAPSFALVETAALLGPGQKTCNWRKLPTGSRLRKSPWEKWSTEWLALLFLVNLMSLPEADAPPASSRLPLWIYLKLDKTGENRFLASGVNTEGNSSSRKVLRVVCSLYMSLLHVFWRLHTESCDCSIGFAIRLMRLSTRAEGTSGAHHVVRNRGGSEIARHSSMHSSALQILNCTCSSI